MAMKIYLGGGFFHSKEQIHNLLLASMLGEFGHEVILPQQERARFITNKGCDEAGFTEHCIAFLRDPECMFVGSMDGAASNTMFNECKIALSSSSHAVLYMTSLKNMVNKEKLPDCPPKDGVIYIHHSCCLTSRDEVMSYYRELARRIHEAVISIEKSGHRM